MAIHLVIKGNLGQATQAAHDHGVSLNQIRAGANQFNESHARCAGDYRARVVAWFCEGSLQAPFPIGTLLLFTEETEGVES
jgi:hypothetical protein